jgi:hypothetical protein
MLAPGLAASIAGGRACKRVFLPKLSIRRYHSSARTMNVSLPEALKAFVDE